MGQASIQAAQNRRLAGRLGLAVMSQTRYRITQRANKWQIDKFDPDTAEWVPLPKRYHADSAELAGRTVDAMVAMDRNKEAEKA